MEEDATSSEENSDLPGFQPDRAHLLLQGVYGNFLHHNDGAHLDRGITDGAICQRCWCQLADQSASWYAPPSGAVGRRFMAILAAKWQGFSAGVGTPRYPLYLPTSFSQRRCAFAGPERSGPG